MSAIYVVMPAYNEYYGENICFKEISFEPRKAGNNSINIRKIVKIGWKALGNFKKFKQGMKKSEK